MSTCLLDKMARQYFERMFCIQFVENQEATDIPNWDLMPDRIKDHWREFTKGLASISDDTEDGIRPLIGQQVYAVFYNVCEGVSVVSGRKLDKWNDMSFKYKSHWDTFAYAISHEVDV